MDDGYSRNAWVISSADSFTKASIEEAKTNHVLLVTGREFAKMIIESGIETLDQAFSR